MMAGNAQYKAFPTKPSPPMTLLTASLYLLCLAFLLGSALFVLSRDPRSRLNRLYALLALSLLGWAATLLAFAGQAAPAPLLLLGRLNFAAVPVAATAALLFVRELAGRPLRSQGWLWAETLALALASLLTGGVDRAERVVQGQHLTAYGPLFPLYLAHVVLLLTLAVLTALRPPPTALPQARRSLRLVGWGMLAAALVGLVTNALLPYSFGDFRWINAGPLATLLFLGSVGYAVFAYHLFSLRIIVRRALVLAGLVTLALELYQLAVTFLSHLLPFGDKEARGYAAATVALAVNAFTQQPVRQWLERLLDRALGAPHGQRRDR
ncbi:MAG: hypothetical protein JO250_20775 [Armatimonadetes bacterium]|nr:hypothetical protein [Armatimonadota bacterium]